MATPATEVGAGAGTVGLLETWEATVESDTPHYRESLRVGGRSLTVGLGLLDASHRNGPHAR